MNYLEISKDMVIPLLAKGYEVYAVVFKSKKYTEKLHKLREWPIGMVTGLLKEEHVKYFYKKDD